MKLCRRPTFNSEIIPVTVPSIRGWTTQGGAKGQGRKTQHRCRAVCVAHGTEKGVAGDLVNDLACAEMMSGILRPAGLQKKSQNYKVRIGRRGRKETSEKSWYKH